MIKWIKEKFFHRDKVVDMAHFPAFFWIIVIFFTLLLWFLWPYLAGLFVGTLLKAENQPATLTELGQFGDMFGAIGALVARLSLAILALSKFEQTGIDKSNFVVAKSTILIGMQQLMNSDDMRNIFQKIEFSQIGLYAEFKNTELERNLDRFLYNLDMICLLRSRQIFNMKDMEYFDYMILQTLQNYNVNSYVRSLVIRGEKYKIFPNNRLERKIEHLPNLVKYIKIRYKLKDLNIYANT